MRFDEELEQFVFEYHGLVFAWDEEPGGDYMEQVKTISGDYPKVCVNLQTDVR